MRKRIWNKIKYLSRKYTAVRVFAVGVVAIAVFIRLIARYRAKVSWQRRVAVATAMSLVFVSAFPMSGRLFAEEAAVPAEEDQGLELEIVDLYTEDLYTEDPGVVVTSGSYALKLCNNTDEELSNLLVQIAGGYIRFAGEDEDEQPVNLDRVNIKTLDKEEPLYFRLKYVDADELAAEDDSDMEETSQDEAAPEIIAPEEAIEPQVEPENVSEPQNVDEPQSEGDADDIAEPQGEPDAADETDGVITGGLSVSEMSVFSVGAALPGIIEDDDEPEMPVIKVYAEDNFNDEIVKYEITGREINEIAGISVIVIDEDAEDAGALETPEDAAAPVPAPGTGSKDAVSGADNKSAKSTGSAASSDEKKNVKDAAGTEDAGVSEPADEDADAVADAADGQPAGDAAVTDDTAVSTGLADGEDGSDSSLGEKDSDKEKNVVEEIDEEDESKKRDDIISVTLPTTFCIPMYESGSDIDVRSDEIKIENHSDFPVDVNISSVSMVIDRDIPKSEIKKAVVAADGETVYDLEKEAKTCHLNLEVLLKGVVSLFSVEEGETKDLTTFTLDDTEEGNHASLSLYGEATYGLYGGWDDGDLKVKITFDFKKHEDEAE